MPVEVHGKATVLYLNQYDVSGWFQTADDGNERDKAETSAFGDNVKQYVPGLADGTLTLQGHYDGGAAATTIDGILSPLQGLIVNVAKFPRGDLVQGYEALIMAGVLRQFSIESSITDAVRINAGVHGGGPYPALLVQQRAAFTTTGNGTALDNAAATTFGGRAQIHVLANTMNNTTALVLEHSVDNSVWTTLAAFTTAPAATLQSQHVAITGTINRYTRLVRTAAGTGSITLACALWRASQ